MDISGTQIITVPAKYPCQATIINNLGKDIDIFVVGSNVGAFYMNFQYLVQQSQFGKLDEFIHISKNENTTFLYLGSTNAQSQYLGLVWSEHVYPEDTRPVIDHSGGGGNNGGGGDGGNNETDGNEGNTDNGGYYYSVPPRPPKQIADMAVDLCSKVFWVAFTAIFLT